MASHQHLQHSHNHAPVKLSFNKAQLLGLLQRFAEGLVEPAFVASFGALAPDEDKMDDFLQNAQIAIIRDFLPGIPPNSVFQDIGRASQSWPGDEEVLAALANISLAEERAIAFALKKEAPSTNLIQITPQIMRQVAEQASKDPQAFQKQQQMLQMMYGNADAMEKLQEHMKTLEASNPEAYAMFSQTLAASAFFAPAHEHIGDHNHSHGSDKANTTQKDEFDDMPPLADSDDDLEDNMV